MIKNLFWLILLGIIFLGCKETEFDNTEITVGNLKEANATLKEAYSQGKVIEGMNYDEKAGNWIILFSDNSSIKIKDKQNGITPLLQTDMNGICSISYDNGESYTKIIDMEENDVIADNGNEVMITVNENGMLCIANSIPNASEEKVIMETTYKANTENIILYIAKNKGENTFTLFLNDDSKFDFNYLPLNPTGIEILNSQTVYMEKMGTSTIEFKITPSMADFNYNVSDNDCEIGIERADNNPTNYNQEIENYTIKRIEEVYDENNNLVEGQYRAYIEDLGKSTTYSDRVSLSLNDKNNSFPEISSSAFNIIFDGLDLANFGLLKKDNNGKVIKDVYFNMTENNGLSLASPYVNSCTALVPSFVASGKVYVDGIEQVSGVSEIDLSEPVIYTVISEYGNEKTYTVSLDFSGLPVVEINTPNSAEITSKEEWMENSTMKILNIDGTVDYEGVMNIRGRGNSTWGYPKKPYAIKLESKAEILGMPKHKRWVLLANWMDRTMMRNNVAFKIGWSTGLAWTPRGENVEVVLNGVHVGNYFLCEDKKISEDRINIHELEGGETGPEEITGGYLLELDTYYDEVNKFKSEYKDFPYMFKEPDEEVLTEEMFNYVQNYVNGMEEALYTEDKFAAGEFKEFMDMESFVDYWIACELTMNPEYGHPKSTYMYKDRGEKLKAGPMWDFDWGTFVPDKANSLQIGNCLYYPQLFKDESFKAMVKERWGMWKENLNNISEYIDEQKEYLKNSDKMNIKMWPINIIVNGDESLSFDDAVNRLKDAYITKLNYLDSYINGL